MDVQKTPVESATIIQLVTCPKCGHSSELGTRYCPNCGESLKNAAMAESAPVTKEERGGFWSRLFGRRS